MLNLVAAELLKLKNNRLFLVATLLTLLIPADLVWMDAGRPQWWIEEIGLQTWFQASVQTTLMIVGPILSGFVLTQLIHQYADSPSAAGFPAVGKTDRLAALEYRCGAGNVGCFSCRELYHFSRGCRYGQCLVSG